MIGSRMVGVWSRVEPAFDERSRPDRSRLSDRGRVLSAHLLWGSKGRHGMNRPVTSLCKKKQKQRVVPKGAPGKTADAQKPDIQEFLSKSDDVGDITFLEFDRKAKEDRPHLLVWLACSNFHNGDYKKAVDAYDDTRGTSRTRKVLCTRRADITRLCSNQGRRRRRPRLQSRT